jgi:adenylate cyclase
MNSVVIPFVKKHKQFTVICLLFTLGFCSLFNAKAQNLDSLYAVWQDSGHSNLSRAKAYDKFIWDGFLFSRPDTAVILADKLISFGNKQPFPLAEVFGLNIKGLASFFLGDYTLALEYYFQSLKIAEQLNDTMEIAGLFGYIGMIYSEKGDYSKAFDYYKKSLSNFEFINNQNGMAVTLGNIGEIFINQGNYPEALNYSSKSLAMNEKMNNQKGIAASLNNIGNLYYLQGDNLKALDYYSRSLAIQEQQNNLKGIAASLSNIGGIYSQQGDNYKALDYYNRSLISLEQLGDLSGIGLVKNSIGSIYKSHDEYDKALNCFNQALAIFEQLGDQKGVAISLNNIGLFYKDQGNLSKAILYCQNGYNTALMIGVLDDQKEACQCLYDAFKAMGKHKEALEYFEKMIVVKDSIYNEENTKELTRLEMQYEFDKKEAVAQAEQEKKDSIATQELKRQKLVRNGFMGGFAVVLLFAGVFLKQRNKIGKEKQHSEELLLNILPYEVAEELKAKGSADAQFIDEVTVLFTDFKGFTSMSEKLSPKDLVKDLHLCFSEFDHIMEKYGIEKIKTIGDAYMAAGGLPTPNKTHPQDVVNAALEMAEVVEKGKAKKIEEGLPFFEIRIGVHTGPVVAGIVGVKKFQYDIWGDTVNTASRMESSGEIGKVNISESTYQLLKETPDFAFESRGKIVAKGKGEIEMFFVSVRSE